MIRITVSAGDRGGTRLRVEGRITRETVAALAAACRDDGTAGLTIDLACVEFVDAAGAALLAAEARRGVRLIGCSDFVRTLLVDPSRAGEGAGASPCDDAAGEPDAAAGAGGAAAGASDEPALLARLRTGDDAAYEVLVRRYGGRMLATARRFVGAEADARDVVQEALLSAFRAIGRFEGGAQLSTWLHRITVNAALMRLRGRRRKREESIDDLLPRFDAEGWWPADGGREPAPAAEEPLERAEVRARVRAAIAQLPESYRTVLLLRDVEDLDPVETAARLGIGSNAVKSRLHRARRALRTLLERGGLLAGARAAEPDPAHRAASA